MTNVLQEEDKKTAETEVGRLQFSTRFSVTSPHNNNTCLFLHSEYLNTMGGVSPEYYSISHYSAEMGMVNHNNSICIYIWLNRSNYITSSTQYMVYVRNVVYIQYKNTPDTAVIDTSSHYVKEMRKLCCTTFQS